MNGNTKGLEKLSRGITVQEADLIRWLLVHGELGSDQLIPQISDLKVVSKCTCGCPTVYFSLRDERSSRKGERIVSDYFGSVEGIDVGVMLFELDGQLSSLEVYSQAGSDNPFGLPAIDSLHA